MNIPDQWIDAIKVFSANKAIDKSVQSLSAAAIFNLLLLINSIYFFGRNLEQSLSTTYYSTAVTYCIFCITILFGISVFGKKTRSKKIIFWDGFIICVIAISNIVFFTWSSTITSVNSYNMTFFDKILIMFFLSQFGWGIVRLRYYNHIKNNLRMVSVTALKTTNCEHFIKEIKNKLFSSKLNKSKFTDITLQTSNPLIPIFVGKTKDYRCFIYDKQLTLISFDIDDIIVFKKPTENQLRKNKALKKIKDFFREEKQKETASLLFFRKFIKRERRANIIINEESLAILEYHACKSPIIHDKRVVRFYNETLSAWSSGKLSKLNKDFEEEGKIQYEMFVWKYRPIEGSGLFVFFTSFPPLKGEFLVAVGNNKFSPTDSAWFVLTNLRLIQRDGISNSFKEVILSEIDTFEIKGKWSKNIMFKMKSGIKIYFEKVALYPSDKFLYRMLGVLSIKDKQFCYNCKLWSIKTELVKKFKIDQIMNLIDIFKNNYYKNIIHLSSYKDDNEYCRLEYFKCPKCNTGYYDIYIKQSSELFEKLLDSHSISGEILDAFEEEMKLLNKSSPKNVEVLTEEEINLFEEQSKQLWRCPNCGELIEGQFTTCWKCGTDRA